MLTAAQCETVAYVNEYGEFRCVECTHTLLEDEGGDAVAGFRPWSRYELDEYQVETSIEYQEQGEYEGCTDDCAPYAVDCEGCGAEIVEPYHYGHEVADDDVDHPVYPEDTP